MNQETGKIKAFTDLRAWQQSHALTIKVYKASQDFPKEEIFGLVNQMRRSAVSITSNIAEGFSRQSYKEKVQFYSIAHGSLTELQNQILIAHDVNLLATDKFKDLENQATNAHKMISCLIKASKKRDS